MTDDHRPDPDALLNTIQRQEARQSRGKLKVYLGLAAGSGKTYTMLQDAHRAKAEGVDVVIGYVQIHGRPETDALVEGLEVVPRKQFVHRETTLEEMDIDAVLARRPQLALVDELAHTNVPGSRHSKRYQDVTELLDAGIDVWTTINVQHIASRIDTVAQITGIIVHETVPDSILDLANQIELIDISPEDLRKRLAEGKIYSEDRIATAEKSFFRPGNLIALREMALRLTAERVDHQLQDYMTEKSIAGPWKASERLMVAVGPSPFSEKLIRWTRRMAYNLEAPWIAVYVQTLQTLSPVDQERLAHNLDLARSLGGQVVTTTANDVAAGLLRVARQHNASQVVVGKPQHNFWQRLRRGGSLVDHVIRTSGDIDVYVVTGDDESGERSRNRIWSAETERHSSWQQYGLALLIVLGVTMAVRWLLDALPGIGYQAVGLTELMAVLLIAAYIGRGPALLAAAVSAVSWNYLFIEPRYTFLISEPADILLFTLYFVIAIFTGNLTARIRTQERQAKANAEYSRALYTLTHETATALNMDDVLRTALTQIRQVFDAEVAIVLAQGETFAPQAHPDSSLVLNEKDYSVARWVFEHGKPAGRFTETLPLATAQVFPLLTPHRTVGVIAIRTRQTERLSFEQQSLLQTFVHQIALVIEREMLDDAATQSAMVRESERLFTTLLNSISHELRTPIATIKGAASSLFDPATDARPDSRQQLTHDIHSAADRLNRLVENLLDMSRLESERLTLKRDWCSVSEIISTAVQRTEPCQDTHTFTIDVGDVPLIQVDFGLMEQALVNLLDNACSYTPPGTTITLRAFVEERMLCVSIRDDGPGIPPDLTDRIFDKFYRLPGTATGGTGLGLSISRGLVEAHGGTLSAANWAGGAEFTMRLPLVGVPPPVQEAAHV